MTETDPGRPDRESGDAGTTGSRRKEVGEPVTPDERESLNIPPNAPDVVAGTPAADLGVPPSESEGTPRRVDRTTAAGTVTGDIGGGRQAHGTTKTDRTSRESVRRDIENDRRELGDTVEALMHKTDVKGRVQETASQVGEDLRRVGVATVGTAAEMVERVKGAAPEVVDRVRDVTPADLKEAAEKAKAQAARRPVAAFVVVAALILIVFRAMRRGKKK
ncbi:DUF3618 domain-containing protein [Streptosporangium sp. NPDC087985]|uniref:DUF3618 domain-containing protein n=1 Tax=Streptosporangium sp. NPDC087985 TaxID=3366196 RepID=UPI00382EFFFB